MPLPSKKTRGREKKERAASAGQREIAAQKGTERETGEGVIAGRAEFRSVVICRLRAFPVFGRTTGEIIVKNLRKTSAIVRPLKAFAAVHKRARIDPRGAALRRSRACHTFNFPKNARERERERRRREKKGERRYHAELSRVRGTIRNRIAAGRKYRCSVINGKRCLSGSALRSDGQ